MRCRSNELSTWGVVGAIGVAVAIGTGAYLYLNSEDGEFEQPDPEVSTAGAEDAEKLAQPAPKANNAGAGDEVIPLEVVVGDDEDPLEAFL